MLRSHLCLCDVCVHACVLVVVCVVVGSVWFSINEGINTPRIMHGGIKKSTYVSEQNEIKTTDIVETCRDILSEFIGTAQRGNINPRAKQRKYIGEYVR